MEKKKSKLKLNKRRVIVLIILALICALVLCGLVKLAGMIFSGNEVVGNLNNMGLAMADGNTTFYNKYEEGIVKVKGGKEYQITDETAYSMTIVDDTIYYLTLSSTNTLDLKSVKTNGDEPTKIKTLSTPSSKFYILDGNVYYITNKEVYGIAKLSLESNEEKMVVVYNVQDFVVDKEAYDYLVTVPKMNDLLMPIPAAVPLQLIAYYTSVNRGNDVDKPRNLAKSVTVE